MGCKYVDWTQLTQDTGHWQGDDDDHDDDSGFSGHWCVMRLEEMRPKAGRA